MDAPYESPPVRSTWPRSFSNLRGSMVPTSQSELVW